MLTCFYKDGAGISSCAILSGEPFPPQTLWVDALEPTPEEENRLRNNLSIIIPSNDEVWKNQILNRLYHENGISYMTAAIITKMKSPHPDIMPVTFVLTDDFLVTIRSITPTSFANFSQRIIKQAKKFDSAAMVLEGLVEEILTRVAHNSEVVMNELDQISHTIFDLDSFGNKKQAKSADMNSLLKRLGTSDDLNSKINESLHSISRLLNFFMDNHCTTDDIKNKVQALITDVKVLKQQSSFLSDKITFQLDATLGLINVEQNMIIKIFSVVAVFFLPPTMISSIYGMNFKHMPELEWVAGYPMAIIIMLLFAVVPFIYFRRNGWL